MDKYESNDVQQSPKRRYNFRKKTRRDRKKNYKVAPPNDDSDSDSDWTPQSKKIEDGSGSGTDIEEYEYDTSEERESFEGKEEEDEMDTLELQRFIQKIFPSKSGQERLEQLEKLDTMVQNQKNRKKKKSRSKYKTAKKKNKKKKIKKKRKKIMRRNPETGDVEEKNDDEEIKNMHKQIEDDLFREEEEIDDVELEEMRRMQNMKFNIIFTVGGEGDYGYEHTEDCNSSSDEEGEDCIKKEKFSKKEKVNIKLRDWDQYYSGTIKKERKNGNYDVTLDDESYDTQRDIHPKFLKSITKEEKFNTLIKEMEALSKTRKKGAKAMMKHLEELSKAAEEKNEKEQKERDKKEQTKNVGKLRKLLREKNVMNDFKYFAKMPIESQKKVLVKLKEVNDYYSVEKPYRISLLESTIPIAFKSQALKKINVLSYMDPGSGEYYKIKQWVDTFMSIPFGKQQRLPIQLSDGKDKCGEFMENAKKILDDCVYGLDDAKMQILQYIGQWISNPSTTGTAIAIKGPPGTGKTTLIKEGISKILARPFAFLALGGATDSSFLEGHSYTYEGSMWGKVVDILIQSKCMNPVIYMDELDKISDTPKGEEITGILTHLTDTTQNDKFHDKYFANVDFDLSKVLFIFSYNDEKKVNPILKDRMYRIHTDGYKNDQKIIIAKKYLIPKIEKNINFEKDNIIIPDDTLTYIMQNYTEEEKGVRNLKRCLEIIYTKINLYRLMKPDSTLFSKETTLKVEFPFTITNQIVGKLIKKGADNSTPFGMYM